ncbi:MAG: hypothetical protein AB1898_20525 [Acidobacteriota bacterium]
MKLTQLLFERAGPLIASHGDEYVIVDDCERRIPCIKPRIGWYRQAEWSVYELSRLGDCFENIEDLLLHHPELSELEFVQMGYNTSIVE